MDYLEWAEQNLALERLSIGGKTTAVWHTKPNPARSNIVFVHGISGDRHGLVPLLARLADTYNCILVELPGHGSSDFLPLRSSRDLQEWWRQATQQIEQRYGSIVVMVAHSFGCLAFSRAIDCQKIMINPVPEPAEQYARYARVMRRLAPFIGLIYNLRWFVWLRSAVLIKNRTLESRRNVRWVSKLSKPSFQQFIYQSRLTAMLSDSFGVPRSYSDINLVIVGISDTSARQRDTLDFRKVFGPDSELLFLRGGHLLPIEDPARVSEVIADNLSGLPLGDKVAYEV